MKIKQAGLEQDTTGHNTEKQALPVTSLLPKELPAAAKAGFGSNSITIEVPPFFCSKSST